MSKVLSSRADLLPKDLRFEHGGAKLVSFPGRHFYSFSRKEIKRANSSASDAMSRFVPARLTLDPSSYFSARCRSYWCFELWAAL